METYKKSSINIILFAIVLAPLISTFADPYVDKLVAFIGICLLGFLYLTLRRLLELFIARVHPRVTNSSILFALYAQGHRTSLTATSSQDNHPYNTYLIMPITESETPLLSGSITELLLAHSSPIDFLCVSARKSPLDDEPL